MIEQINMALFHLINQYAGLNLFIDSIAILFAEYMPLIFVISLVYLWFKKGDNNKDTLYRKKDDKKKDISLYWKKDDTNRDIALYSVYAAVLGLFINFVIGYFYYHSRPFVEHAGTLLFPYSTDSSFPSDHATLMLSIALMMIYFKETRKLGILLVILGLIGGFARVFVGVHWPFDIIGSLLVAIIASLSIYYFKDSLNFLNRIIKAIYFKIVGR
jgi:undecaprenyl-diphosphatase